MKWIFSVFSHIDYRIAMKFEMIYISKIKYCGTKNLDEENENSTDIKHGK